MQVQDALLFIVDCLRRDRLRGTTTYGYELYLPPVIHMFLVDTGTGERIEWGDHRMKAASPAFLDAAWELCRRGILRPGIREWKQQGTPEGAAGLGFTVTPFGRAWLAEADKDAFVPTEPERFAKLMAPFADRFGVGFKERSQEAIRCYGAHAYLACCAMCGAAAESVLLAVAIAKEGDGPRVMKEYRSAHGRSRVEHMVVGKAPDALRLGFLGLTGLLKYWRDASAHGEPANIADDEAYTSIALLLRYSQFVHLRWSELVEQPPSP